MSGAGLRLETATRTGCESGEQQAFIRDLTSANDTNNSVFRFAEGRPTDAGSDINDMFSERLTMNDFHRPGSRTSNFPVAPVTKSSTVLLL